MLALTAQQRIGSFILLERIGAGGVGEVWKALDHRLNRIVALKFIRDTDRRESVDLLREARAASALNHPNIITVLEVGEGAGGVYLATEFVEGETLRARMDREEIPLKTAIDIGIQMSRGLGAAHEIGIVHRDIKPENVMLRIDGYVKVVDFGLAKRAPWARNAEDDALTRDPTDTGSISGTFSYMSPEQARGHEVGPSSDVFSMGIVLYELLTGKHPFRADTPIDTLHRIINQEPGSTRELRPELPQALHETIEGCLQKSASDRFPGATVVESRLVAGQHAPPSKPSSRTGGRWRIASWVAGLVLALCLAAWTFWPVPPGIPASVHSLAILNLKATSREAATIVFAGNLSEELGSVLSSSGFQVAARSRVLAVEGPGDAQSVGSQLHVDAVVEGTVETLENGLHIYVEVVDSKTGFQIWSKSLLQPVHLTPYGSQETSRIAAELRDAMTRGR